MPMSVVNAAPPPTQVTTSTAPPTVMENGLTWVQISTPTQLEYVDQNPTSYLGANLELMDSIDLPSGYAWTPFGGNAEAAFTGKFDGQGHAISGVMMDDTTLANVGFFGVTDGIVENLSLSDVNIHGGTGSTGGLAGTQDGGILNNVNTSGAISGGTGSMGVGSPGTNGGLVGGLVGDQMSGSINTAYSTANVVGGAGGSGSNPSGINGAASVGGTGGAAGGLIGESAGSIAVAYATGSVQGGAGGPGGSADYTSVGGVGGVAGGLVGQDTGSIMNAYSTGAVTGGSGGTALNVSPVVYLTEGLGGAAGGLVGQLSGTLTDTYATGLVTPGMGGNSLSSASGLAGGLVGSQGKSGMTVADFFDTTTTGQMVGVGNDPSVAGVIGAVTNAMQTPSLYTDAGWNFHSVWKISPVLPPAALAATAGKRHGPPFRFSGGLPYLRALAPSNGQGATTETHGQGPGAGQDPPQAAAHRSDHGRNHRS